jgi:hypothetical protein
MLHIENEKEEFVVSVIFTDKEAAKRFFKFATEEWLENENSPIFNAEHVSNPVKYYFLDSWKENLEILFWDFLKKFWKV